MSGTLFVVATPIGNLEDLTFRALRILREVDLIAAEDTRRTSKLLAHYGVRKPLVSLREHNEQREIPRLIERLSAGESIAVVSDAGTPGISDPGADLVGAARRQSIAVVPIPGPSAVTTALSAAGFPAPTFVFLGFPPSAGVARESWFQSLEEQQRTVVLFEAPHRLENCIGHLATLAPPRRVIIFGELTKMHERSIDSDSSALRSDAVRATGEFVIVVGPTDRVRDKKDVSALGAELVGHLTDGRPLGETEAVEIVARVLDLPRSRVANAFRKRIISVKQQKAATS